MSLALCDEIARSTSLAIKGSLVGALEESECSRFVCPLLVNKMVHVYRHGILADGFVWSHNKLDTVKGGRHWVGSADNTVSNMPRYGRTVPNRRHGVGPRYALSTGLLIRLKQALCSSDGTPEKAEAVRKAGRTILPFLARPDFLRDAFTNTRNQPLLPYLFYRRTLYRRLMKTVMQDPQHTCLGYCMASMCIDAYADLPRVLLSVAKGIVPVPLCDLIRMIQDAKKRIHVERDFLAAFLAYTRPTALLEEEEKWLAPRLPPLASGRYSVIYGLVGRFVCDAPLTDNGRVNLQALFSQVKTTRATVRDMFERENHISTPAVDVFAPAFTKHLIPHKYKTDAVLGFIEDILVVLA